MANQKTSDLRRMLPGELAVGDLFPVVDVSEPTSPTGENKKITVEDFATYVYENYTPAGGRFTLTFPFDSSGYLLNASSSNVVLPPNYVLTSAVLKTSGKPLLSIGTSEHDPLPHYSVTGSWNDNRVYPTSCSYDVNYLELSNYGAVHVSRSIWIEFHSGSACPCTLSLDGFVR